MAWTNTGGGNHEGADWTPGDSTSIGGTHTNVGMFTVENGVTVTVAAPDVLSIYANEMYIIGIINGTGYGNPGGAAAGAGSSGNEGASTGHGGAGTYLSGKVGGGGGGAGYGGVGQIGAKWSPPPTGDPGHAGIVYGATDTKSILSGSGGGSGGASNSGSGTGGDGGAGIYLSSKTFLTVSGSILCDGVAGSVGGTYAGSGGGGSGGGILLSGSDVTISGMLSVAGEDGGAAPTEGTKGGDGGGGRIKVFYYTLDISGSTFIYTGFTSGTNYSTQDTDLLYITSSIIFII